MVVPGLLIRARGATRSHCEDRRPEKIESEWPVSTVVPHCWCVFAVRAGRLRGSGDRPQGVLRNIEVNDQAGVG